MKYISILFISIVLINNITKSQNKDKYYIESKFHYGFIAQHRPTMNDLIKYSSKSIDLLIGKQTFGKKYWEQLYRYPSYGIGYYWVDLGNPSMLGNANALYFFVNIPVFYNNKYSIDYNMASGLSYLQKGNKAIGSHFNVYVNFSTNIKYRLYRNLWIVSGVGATHFSNGAIKMPNLGINLLTYRIGFKYNFKNDSIKNIVHDIPKLKNKNQIKITFGAGIKEMKPDGGHQYFVSSYVLDYCRILNHKRRIGLGFDFFHDNSLYKELEKEGYINPSANDIRRYGLHLSHELTISRLSIIFHLGIYLKSKWKEQGVVYQRAALNYRLVDNLHLNISLKTYKGIADYVEFGFAYSFLW